jgi:hypothetical protein
VGVGGAGRRWKFPVTSTRKDDMLVLDDSIDTLLIRGDVDNDEAEEEREEELVNGKGLGVRTGPGEGRSEGLNR